MEFSISPIAKGLNISFYKKGRKVEWGEEKAVLEREYLELTKTWHEKRQAEFLLGRHLIHKTFVEHKIESDDPILIGEKREPLLPKGISGSLTHNENYVAFAFHPGNRVVGIDIESRGRVKPAMEKQILREEDFELIKNLEGEIERGDLLTLIFSAKESCYKGLFPFCREYFGFQDAFMKTISFKQKTFKIQVLKSFEAPLFKKVIPLVLEGGFEIDGANIFSYLAPVDPNDFKGIES